MLLVYLVEILPKKDRIWVTTVISWSPNVILFAIIAYHSKNWRTLAIASSLLALPGVFLFIIAFESPRWLIEKGHIDRAHDVLRRIAKFNGQSDITNDMIDEVIDMEKQVRLVFCWSSIAEFFDQELSKILQRFHFVAKK
ncbi:unnamed protein product [Gongylonema pulchrum]|uniref:MFS domain-containing protein n=1 Tax=Gongylonema pulchrum TaxID=637853 RepID=A0A3P7MYX1_9BILA|nr:unnamed protein product [Gongylonema pulchrum]